MIRQVHSFIPKQDGKIVFYEVTNMEGNAEWGGEQPNEALLWYARDPLNKRVIASLWYADEEDAAPLGTIDVTALVLAAMAQGRGRA